MTLTLNTFAPDFVKITKSDDRPWTSGWWNRDQLFELKKLWDYDLLTQSQCARHFKVTPSKIAGMIHRHRDEYGYSRRPIKPGKRRPPRQPRVLKVSSMMLPASVPKKIKPSKFTANNFNAFDSVARPEPAPVELSEAPPMGQRKTLFELEKFHCRWPIGERGDLFYCGAQVTVKHYCDYHSKIGHR